MAVRFESIPEGAIRQLTVMTGKADKKVSRDLYRIDAENGNIYIPFHIANTIYGQNNDGRTFNKRRAVRFDGTLRPEQVTVLEEAQEILNEKRSIILNLHTGFGKTITALVLYTIYRLRTCILVTQDPLCVQWLETINTLFPGIKVGVLGTKGSNADDLLDCDIIIAMERRVKYMNFCSLFGMLIVDEAHSFTTKARFELMMKFRPKYLVALSATARDNSSHAFVVIENIFGTVKDNGIVRKDKTRELTVHKVLTPFTVEYSTGKSGRLDFQAYERAMLLEKEDRNDFSYRLVRKLYSNPENKIMIITSRVEHMNMVVENLSDLDIDNIGGKKKTYEDSRILVATTTKVKEGFDERTFCKGKIKGLINTIIFLCTFKADVLREQLTGRSRAAKVHVYHFIDNTTISEKHYKISEAIYKSLNANFEELNIRKIDVDDRDKPKSVYKRSGYRGRKRTVG